MSEDVKIDYDPNHPSIKKRIQMQKKTDQILNRIKSISEEKGISLNKILHKHRLSGAFNKWENYEDSPKLKQLFKIADELNVSIEYLLFGISTDRLVFCDEFNYDPKLVKSLEIIDNDNELIELVVKVAMADEEHRKAAYKILASSDIDVYQLAESINNNPRLKKLLDAANGSPENIRQATEVLNTDNINNYVWKQTFISKYKNVNTIINFLVRVATICVIPFIIFSLVFFHFTSGSINDRLTTSYNNAMMLYDTEIYQQEEAQKQYKQELKAYNEQMDSINAFKETAIVPIEVSATCSMTGGSPVGSEIDYDLRVNDRECFRDIELEYKIGDKLNVSSSVTDDEELPDRDEANDSITISIDELKEGYTFTQQMFPHETHGKFSGNTAEYTATYTFKLKDGFNADVLQEDLSQIVEPEKPVKPEEKTIAKPEKVKVHSFEVFGFSKVCLIIYLLVLSLFVWIAAFLFYESND